MANFKDHLQKMAQPFLVKCILLFDISFRLWFKDFQELIMPCADNSHSASGMTEFAG